jgi:GT2 family glycosyltransferase
MKTIPAIIPYFKAPDKLDRCVKALDAQIDIPIDVFIRDNSNDNILFTRAVNEGLRNFVYSESYEYTLIINQDAYLKPGCLAYLVDLMTEYPRCGIACPVQYNSNGEVTWHGSLDAYPFGVHAGKPSHLKNTSYETYWANGACLLVRNSMVREIGLLDENMLFICSDSDYSFTARARGWSIMVCSQASVEHALDASGSSDTPYWLTKQKLEDQIFFAKKWLTGDLYKYLSFEGESLTDVFVREKMKESEKILQRINTLMESM